MGYMANHFDKRLDPRLLVDNAKTVVSLLLNYFPEERQNGESPKISKYAYGEDYHNVIKDKLKDLLTCLKEEVGDISGRAFVDSAPVMDKVWAKKAGLGWIGKNSNLIHPKEGSFFFIAELIIDLELEPDGPMKDYCGTCTRCIDACPTNAIVQPYVVDGSKCISYLTIELKDELLPKEFSGKMDNWMFGCDVCQDVCPWNRFSKITQESRFKPNPMLLELKSNDWQELNEEVFNQLFKLSAVKRTKITGLTRNIKFLT
jgi:epoxyqueuosine reductase